MFTATAFALEQIKTTGLTECAINDASGVDRLGYFAGKPHDVAAWLESSLVSIAGPVTVLAWNDDVKKGGKPGEKKVSQVHRWRMYGTHGQDKQSGPVVVTGPASPAPAVDVDAAIARAIAAERSKWEAELLRAEVAELRKMLTAPDDDNDDGDDDGDDDDDAEADTVSTLVDLVRELAGTRKLPEPKAPAMNGTQGAQAAPDTPEGWTDQERDLVLAIRNARAQHPKETGDYIDQVIKSYGGHG